MSPTDLSPSNPAADDDQETALPRFSLDRRVTVTALLLTILVVGMIATVGIPLELFPRGWDAPNLTVQATWREAPPQEMLDQVALPLEEEISTIPGLENLYTYSTRGFTRLTLAFEGRTDMDVAYRELRDRIERAKARMPDGVDRVLIRKSAHSEIPVMAFGITAEPEVLDAYDLIQNEIVRPIERVDGVGGVDVQGLMQKEVLIELDRARTEAAGLDVFRVGRALQRDNFTMASGHVTAAGKKLLLRSVARYEDLDALRNRKMSRDVRLGDIATVRYAEREKDWRVRADGKPAFFAIVRKETAANAIDVSRRLQALVAEMDDNPQLALFGVEVFFDQGQAILDALGILVESGQIGAVLAACVLFFFLRRVRLTLIISLSIPLSLFLGMTAMYFLGETLNILSLLGLMISVGLLVDNSVVVAENIFRLHAEGMERREAAIRGAGEISLAVVMATLTTMIVFLPVSLVEGPGRFFLLRLSIPITASLLASLFVALVFVPLASYVTLPPAGTRRTTVPRWRRALRGAYERSFGALERLYQRLLASALRRRVDLAVAVTAAVVITAALPMREVDFAPLGEAEHGGLELGIDLPAATTLEEADVYFRQVESILAEKKEEWDLRTTLVVFSRSSGEVQAWFDTPRTNEVTEAEVLEGLRAALPEKGGVALDMGEAASDQEDTATVHTLTLTGNDHDELERVAESLEETFLRVPGVLGIQRAGDRVEEELAVAVDRQRAQRLGIEPMTVAGVVRNALGGAALPKIYREGREIPVRLRFQEADRETVDQLLDFRVPTATGERVRLSSVAATERLDPTGRIFRTNRQTSRRITLRLDEDRSKAARARVEEIAAAADLPEGVRFGRPRRGGSSTGEVASMAFAAGLSVVFIYLLMGFLFESFVLPLSIVTTIPLAILGVYWGHWIAGVDLDLLGMVGMVLLIGVVVNNGIVLVDYTNRLRERGRTRPAAVLEAAHHRFRPIMMTALTTISGMVPLLFGGDSSLGLSYESFAVTLIGGMAVATLLTLLVVPATYTVFDDLRRLLGGAVRRWLFRRDLPQPVADAALRARRL